MIEIRPFEKADQPALETLWSRVFADDPPWNHPAVLIASKLKVQPELLLVAILDGRLVGAVMAGFDGVRGWIYHLAVEPEHATPRNRSAAGPGGRVRAARARLPEGEPAGSNLERRGHRVLPKPRV